MRSGFGQQCLATRVSAPACGFGSSNRDAYSKVRRNPDSFHSYIRKDGNMYASVARQPQHGLS